DLVISVNAQPENPEWFLALGRVYFDTKHFDAAVNLNTTALRVNDKEPRYYNNRGVAYRELNRLDEAVADFSKAIELKPDFGLAYRNAGQVFYKARNYEKALAVLAKAIELSPRDARAYSLRAACRTAVGDLARAEADRRTAAELNARLQQAGATSPPVPT